jgi:hypothetical protein
MPMEADEGNGFNTKERSRSVEGDARSAGWLASY